MTTLLKEGRLVPMDGSNLLDFLNLVNHVEFQCPRAKSFNFGLDFFPHFVLHFVEIHYFLTLMTHFPFEMHFSLYFCFLWHLYS